MPTPTYPGVYVAETPGGARPLDIASTSTAAFLGLAEMGPETATRVTSWTEFQRLYGSFTSDGFLAHSVFQYFNNGGRMCYIVRVVRPDATAASVTVNNRADTPAPGVVFSARSRGRWGNTLLLQISNGTNDPGNEFRLRIRRQRDASESVENANASPPLEDFDNLGVDPAMPNFVVAVLARNSTLLDAQIVTANTVVQRGRLTGGGPPTLPLGANRTFHINLDSDGFQQVALPDAAGTAGAAADVAAAIQTAVRALTKRRTSTDATAFSGFTCTVEPVEGSQRLVLRSGTTTALSSVRVQPGAANDGTESLRLSLAAGARAEDGAAPRRPANAEVIQVGDAAKAPPVADVAPGDDGKPERTTVRLFSDAFSRLDGLTDASLLAVPGEGTPAMLDSGLAYCAQRPLQDMFYLGETDWHDDTVAEAEQFRRKLTLSNSYGALYFPWVKAIDPAGVSDAPILLPPSGYVAGLYARIDARRGVWKAPAGTEAGLNGVVGLAAELGDVQHGVLNPLGVNVVRRFPGVGVVAFGARTITSDPAWRHVPVRRTAIMLRVSIYNGIQWAVFEPNDEPLWSQLRLSIGSFMMTLYRQQAFQGATPSQAFFVKCDAETTTQADIDAGVVNIQVGFAPLKPAEFVIVKISQQAGLASG
ncbi:phage tail sheath C-terminal domain-containing protein [Nonomuraea wenchangensis]